MSEELPAQKQPPHNLEAERALLGAILLDSERVSDVADLVGPESFFDRRNAQIFETVLGLFERHVPVDAVSLAESLRGRGKIDEVGGLPYLLQLMESVTSSAHVAYHGRIVAETALLRRLIRESGDIIGEAYATRPDGESVQKLLDEAEHRVLSLSLARNEADAKAMSDLLREAVLGIQRPGGPRGVVTGYYDLDELLCGFNPGDMIVLAARPGMGKTALALNLVMRAALREQPALEAGRRAQVLLFSLEMGSLDLVRRMLSTQAKVDSSRLRAGTLSLDERNDIVAAADELQRAEIHIDDTPGLTVLALKSRARRHLHRHGLDMIVVDYLQLVAHPKAESRQMEISYISRSLKAIARELKVPLIALSQLNRGVETRPGKDQRPRLSDLRESGSIEQDSDVVILIHRPDKTASAPEEVPEDMRGVVELVVAKHRNGPTGIVRLQFFEDTMRFESREAAAVPVSGI